MRRCLVRLKRRRASDLPFRFKVVILLGLGQSLSKISGPRIRKVSDPDPNLSGFFKKNAQVRTGPWIPGIGSFGYINSFLTGRRPKP